jgi:hypothetical protein
MTAEHKHTPEELAAALQEAKTLWLRYERLSAAAPEMLEALKDITSLLGNVDHSRGGGENTARLYGGMLESIRELAGAAIAKAEG